MRERCLSRSNRSHLAHVTYYKQTDAYIFICQYVYWHKYFFSYAALASKVFSYSQLKWTQGLCKRFERLHYSMRKATSAVYCFFVLIIFLMLVCRRDGILMSKHRLRRTTPQYVIKIEMCNRTKIKWLGIFRVLCEHVFTNHFLQIGVYMPTF